MRCKIMMLGTLLTAFLTACGDPEPVSTGTKAPGLNKAAATPAPSTTDITGDATKGQTALTTNCNICHGKSAFALNKTHVAAVDAAATKSYHLPVKQAFDSSAADIKAYLVTQ